jgi:hypothetical protein
VGSSRSWQLAAERHTSLEWLLLRIQREMVLAGAWLAGKSQCGKGDFQKRKQDDWLSRPIEVANVHRRTAWCPLKQPHAHIYSFCCYEKGEEVSSSSYKSHEEPDHTAEAPLLATRVGKSSSFGGLTVIKKSSHHSVLGMGMVLRLAVKPTTLWKKLFRSWQKVFRGNIRNGIQAFLDRQPASTDEEG